MAVFDTAFHQTLPPAYTYAIPLKYLHQHQVRRYGFRGTSHRFIAAEAVERLVLTRTNHGLLCCPSRQWLVGLRGENGQSVDTSMGATPLGRAGDGNALAATDGARAYIARCTGQTIESLYKMVNNEAGLFGLSVFPAIAARYKEARGNGDPGPSRLMS
ncbi:hypothetical protein DMH17_15225 [Raoultella planticola]|nr:hypothetical protein [Raoultella planticola]